MCSINHEKKIIFIHLNIINERKIIKSLEKNGFKFCNERRPDYKLFCDNTEESCAECNSNHSIYKNDNIVKYFSTSYFINRITNMNEEKWNTYRKICIAINPYDRLLFLWKYLNKYSDKELSLEEFINKKHISEMEYKNLYTPQSKNIYDDDKNQKLEIIYYENLKEELKKILDKESDKEFDKESDKEFDKESDKEFNKESDNNESDSSSDEGDKDDETVFDKKTINKKILARVNEICDVDFSLLVNYQKIDTTNDFITYIEKYRSKN